MRVMKQIPESFQGSAALQLVLQQGWEWKLGTIPNIILGKCPYCSKTDHCYVECHGSVSDTKQRDGLFLCQKCGRSGNLYTLKQHLGLITPGVVSQKDWASSEKKADQLPDVEMLHTALLADTDALDYLVNIRGISIESIKEFKLGLKEKHFFKSTGEVRALVIPYILNGNCIWAKYRTLPDPSDLKKVPKDFNAPQGWDATLFNIEALTDGVSEIILVEGEMDCICAVDKGISNTCGVPGANIKKAEWLTKLDAVEKVYILYDNDKVGQKAAQELACRVGIEKCWKINLPVFTVTTEDGKVRNGKDINEWFVAGGGTLEKFEELKANAVLFDVEGTKGIVDALDELTEEMEGKGAGQKYIWPLIQDLVQFDEGDCIMLLGPEKSGKSVIAMNLVEYMVDQYQEVGAIVCLEMTRAKQARRWVSHKAGISDNLPKTPEEAQSLTDQFKDAIPKVKEIAANRPGDLLLCYPHYTTEEDIYKLVIDIIRRYGATWIVIDNLQLLCDTTIKGKNRTEHLSQISKRLTKIGKDYGVQMVILLQPHRIGENRLATSDSVDGASQVAKDADVFLTINRSRIGEVTKDMLTQGAFIQTEGSFAPEMLMTCSLSRYSAGGSTTLYFNGATSTVHKLTEGKIAAMNDGATKGIGYQKQAEALNLPLAALKQALTDTKPEPDGEIVV
jgi:5S rRNA maturation endonuclease (ribonuclease M5)